jgi:hypothetical protein
MPRQYKLRKLKNEIRDRCHYLKHDMTQWRTANTIEDAYFSYCNYCAGGVVIMPSLQGDLRAGGRALNETCTGRG